MFPVIYAACPARQRINFEVTTVMVFSMYDPKLLEGVRTIHFIGCGGSGTYPLIQILHSRGLTISGSGEAPVFQSADDQPLSLIHISETTRP